MPVKENAIGRKSLRRVAVASTIGTSLEWFDFFIFTTMTALVFNQLFFSNLSPQMGIVAALATFATGFITRPLGAIVFGHLGDRIGRKSTMIITMLLMGAATFAVGLLPTYEQVGVWAPLLLLLLRMIQGLGLGGEWGGAVLLCVEHASPNKRGLFGSFPQLGVSIGAIMSFTLVAILTNFLSQSQFLAWGWRIPFLISIILVAIGLFIRFKIIETPAFTTMKEMGSESKSPVLEAIRTRPRITILALGSRLSESLTSNILGFFSLVYLTQYIDVPYTVSVIMILIATASTLITIPLAGMLSDRFGRRPVYMAGLAFTILFAFPAFWLIDTQNPILICLSLILGFGVGWGFMYGPQAAFYAELYPPNVRYSGMGFVYAIGALPSGAIGATIAALLLNWSGHSWTISVYLILFALISLVSVYFLPETHKTDIKIDDLSKEMTVQRIIEKQRTEVI